MAQSVSLDVLSQLKGKSYLEERDKFLQDPAQIQAALTHLQDTVWRVRIQAKIIQGWATESALYRQILSELDAVNYEREQKTVVGIGRIWDMLELRTAQEYHERVLPLAWEVIGKFQDDWPDWKVATFLHMIGGARTEESIEPVMTLMETTDHPLLRSAASQALAKLPLDAVRKRLAAAEAEHQAVLRAIAETRRRFE